MLIDSHCHLETFARRGDLDAVLARAAAADVGRVVTIGTSPDDWALYARLAARHPGRVDFTVGLHPNDVGRVGDWPAAVAQLPAFFRRGAAGGPRPVALGEIGLDRHYLPKEPAAAAEVFARQEAAFRAQLALAREFAVPVVVHSRAAFADCVRVLDDSGADWRRVVFHCFSDGPDELRALRARGGRASFTGIITYKSAAAMRAALVAQGLDALLVETDAPYLAPEPHRGQTNEPAFVAHTARAAAQLLGVTFAELAARTTHNAREFFGLNHAAPGGD